MPNLEHDAANEGDRQVVMEMSFGGLTPLPPLFNLQSASVLRQGHMHAFLFCEFRVKQSYQKVQ